VVGDKVKLTSKKGQLMSQEEMVSLIRQVWSDAMSDSGAVWAKSNAELEKAKDENYNLYQKALPIARKLGIGF
jgi:predicted Zn-dependent protease